MPQLPNMPLQQGANLGALDLDKEEDFEKAMMQEKELEHYEEVLGLEPDEADEEVIEMDDGSVVINYKPTEGPLKNPEFYANLAEDLDEDRSE